MRIASAEYAAESIEHSFARLFNARMGQRGEAWDADVFRGGNVKKIGAVLVKAANQLENRISKLTFSEKDSQPGGDYAILEVAIKRIGDMGAKMQSDSDGEQEPSDYHWLIIGEMVDIISVMLDRLS